MTIDFVPDEAQPVPVLTSVPAVDADPLADVDDGAWDVLTRLAESLHLKEPDLPTTLEAVLRVATELIPSASAAGLNLYERGRFTPQAVFGRQPLPLDELQKRTGEGPCIEASRSQDVVHIADMRTDDRWSKFRALAIEEGVLAMLCVPLRVDDMRVGSLSLYFAAPDDRRDHDEQLARILGAQAALAIAGAQRSDNLRVAMGNRDLIGQAKGILMERHRITADQAFAALTHASQVSNRKLVVVAEEFVLTGELTGAEGTTTRRAPH